MKIVVVKQHDLKDCGACCLKSIIESYNGSISLEKIRLDTNTTATGTNALNLVEAAKKYGFDSVGVKVESLEDETIRLPAIAHVTTKQGLLHFVVIYKLAKRKVYLMDPAVGKVTMSIEAFQNIWNNTLLMFYPKRPIIFLPKENSLWQIFEEIVKKEKRLFLHMIITSILLTIFSIICTYYFKVALNTISENKELIVLKIVILVFFICLIFKLVLGHIRRNLEMHLNKNVDILLYENFFDHLFSLPLEVITSRSIGEISTRVKEMDNIKALFTEIVIAGFLDLLLMITSMPILYSINHQLFLVLFFMMSLYLLIGLLTSKRIYKKAYQNIEKEAEFNSTLIEHLGLINTIKNLNLVKKALQKIEKIHCQFLHDGLKLMKNINSIMNLKLIIYEIGLFAINTMGFWQINNEQLTIAELITFNTLVVYFLDPIKNIIDSLPKYNFIKATFSKINEFINIEKEKLGNKEDLPNKSISFNEVEFSYDTYHTVLKKCHFQIAENEFVLLKGKSGSGKSTICKILEKYVKDYKGEVQIGGINLHDYSIATIRNAISHISQKERILTGSIKDNILMGRNVSIEVYERICKVCLIDEIVKKKPLRYETIISDESSFISGGEKARIILARALLKDAGIYLIDEALSEVDHKMEQTIIKNLQHELRDKTVIYITHKKQENLFKKIITLEETNEL